MKKLLLTTFCMLLLCKAAAANDFNIYPIPAVFVSKDQNSQRFEELKKAKINDFNKAFISKFVEFYPNAQTEISDKTKYKTFAAFVHIPRVSEYILNKNGIIAVYLPMTMSINFVNMATSETLYSYPMTIYQPYETTQELYANKAYTDAKINELYFKTYETLLSEIIPKASQDFKPFSITTKLKDRYKNVYIFDKGTTSGIAKGDLLTDNASNQLSVIYSNLEYSVAEPLLGKPQSGAEFSKFSNSNIMQLKKPKVLFVNNLGSEKLYNLFSSALGTSADFSLINVDKSFYDMQTALVSLNDKFKTNNIQNREIPDYFLKLFLTNPIYTQYKSDSTVLNLDKYSMIACGVIFDRTGRIVFSKCTDDEIAETVVDNMRFNNIARYEVLTKNVLSKLAVAFQNEVKFNDTNLKITKISGQFIDLDDPNGFLKSGNTISVFKKVSTEKGGTQILVPTWEYKVMLARNGIAECKAMYPLIQGAEYPSKNDIAQITTITRAANTANMFNYSNAKELDGNDISIKDFDRIIFPAVSSEIKSPLAMSHVDLVEQIKELNTGGYNFKKQIEMPEENADKLKIRPVYKIKLENEKQKGTMIEQTYSITVGIVSFDGEKVLNKDGLIQKVIIDVPQNDNEQIIKNELLKKIYPLIIQISRKF